MSKKRKNKTSSHCNLIIGFSFLFILLFFISLLFLYPKKEENNKAKISVTKIDLDQVKNQYNDFVEIKDGSSLYTKDGEKYKKISIVHGNIELCLDSNYKIVDEYFKVLDSDFYVKYNDVTKLDNLTTKVGEYKYYQNYVVYNENVILTDGAKLYVDDSNYYEVFGGNYPIIIKDIDSYGIEFNNSLVYVSTEDVNEVVENHNTNLGHADGLSVLNYHYVVSSTDENGEKTECKQSICITDEMFDSHVKYLKDNGYYAVSMRDLELFIDGKIQLPEKSVSLTFDDGWYVARTIGILEKYQLLGTLFLIGSLSSPESYVSEYLEIHSHTWNMHKLGDCPANVGRGGILCLDESTILEDLKKSRESLNNTTYFCYPFYDYNERAIELLKKAGFTMAFAGEFSNSTIRVGQDKFKIPRYVIVNSTTMDEFIQYVS